MNQYAGGTPGVSMEALLTLRSQYCRISPEEMAGLFTWMAHGTVPESLHGKYNEEWLRLAVQQCRDAAVFSDKWLHVNIETLFSQKLNGLDDFSLATYAAAVLERDHEYCNVAAPSSSWSKICDVYNRIVDNARGTVLLNYSWLYSDMLQLAMASNPLRLRQLYDMALAFELRWGTADGVRRFLVAYAGYLIQTGNQMKGTLALARILETHRNCFEVYEAAVNTLFDVNKVVLGQMVLDAMASIAMNKKQRGRYRALCRCYFRESCPHISNTPEQQRFIRALSTSQHLCHRPCLSSLVREQVPHIEKVPVKQLDIVL